MKDASRVGAKPSCCGVDGAMWRRHFDLDEHLKEGCEGMNLSCDKAAGLTTYLLGLASSSFGPRGRGVASAAGERVLGEDNDHAWSGHC